MNNKSGNIFIILGGFFILFGVFLFTINSFDTPFGTIFLNLILFLLDCLWLIGTGLFILISGFQIKKLKQNKTMDFKICSYFSIFNINFLVFSFIFNLLAEPLAQSNGRILTYFFQSGIQIINPSLSVGLIIPLISIVFFIVSFVQFRRKYAKEGS
jgi:hypothetical protein